MSLSIVKKLPKNNSVSPLKRNVVDKRPAFLAAYRATASITKASAACQLDRHMHYDWLADEDYAADFAQAQVEAGQLFEDEAIRRAHDGVETPIVYQGQLCYPMLVNPETGEVTRSNQPLMETKRSDTLLLAVLKRFKPEYRERGSLEVTGAGGGPITVDARLAVLTDEELATLIAVTEKIVSAGSAPGGAAPTQPAAD